MTALSSEQSSQMVMSQDDMPMRDHQLMAQGVNNQGADDMGGMNSDCSAHSCACALLISAARFDLPNRIDFFKLQTILSF